MGISQKLHRSLVVILSQYYSIWANQTSWNIYPFLHSLGGTWKVGPPLRGIVKNDWNFLRNHLNQNSIQCLTFHNYTESTQLFQTSGKKMSPMKEMSSLKWNPWSLVSSVVKLGMSYLFHYWCKSNRVLLRLVFNRRFMKWNATIIVTIFFITHELTKVIVQSSTKL